MAFTYSIRQIVFRDGAEIDLSELNVFVGANNSGKSRLLKDILSFATERRPKPVILGRVWPSLPGSLREVVATYPPVFYKGPGGDQNRRELKPDLASEWNHNFSPGEWEQRILDTEASPENLAGYFGNALISFLTTSHRLRLIDEGHLSGDTRGTLLQELYAKGTSAEKEIRGFVERAFPGRQLALDFTNPPNIQFRVARSFDGLPPDPRDARPIMNAAERLDDQGDGIRSYATIVTALVCTQRPVMMIDEPEAFLHPPQAFRIGQLIASFAAAGQQIIVATHSVDVLRGIATSNKQAQIIRLERTADAASHRLLRKEYINALYADPLLSSAGILNGLFFTGTVVTEADGDSRFYQAISNRLEPGRDLHFINADNKQTIPKVLKSYRIMGVRAAGIVDIDVINDGEEFKQFIATLDVSASDQLRAIQARDAIAAYIEKNNAAQRLAEISRSMEEIRLSIAEAASKDPNIQDAVLREARSKLGNLREKSSLWSDVKKSGRAALSTVVNEFDTITEILLRHGVVVNPAGELEASLTGYGVRHTSNKKLWLQTALTRIPTLEIRADQGPGKLMQAIHTFLNA